MKIVNIINKIKKFFSKRNTKLLNKSMYTEIEDANNNEKDRFMESVEVKKDIDKLSLLKLQEELEQGVTMEKELTKEEMGKMNILYDEQIAELKEKIEQTKNETRHMLDRMKKLQQV
ncbi:MAG: hypothetical protein FWC68_06135 [Oscillospiraceae bacterium]|nr:hypothetical protein [Oscillospiraceae bacterium]